MLDENLLLRTADRCLRRKYANDIPGLTQFADSLASNAQSSAVTITATSNEGGGAGSGVLTMPREVWLMAAEELLANPSFNPAAGPSRPRVILPDYRLASPV